MCTLANFLKEGIMHLDLITFRTSQDVATSSISLPLCVRVLASEVLAGTVQILFLEMGDSLLRLIAV